MMELTNTIQNQGKQRSEHINKSKVVDKNNDNVRKESRFNQRLLSQIANKLGLSHSIYYK